MKKFLLAALLAGVATSAFAADLPTRKGPPPAPVSYAPPPFSWTGLYVGLNAGVGFGEHGHSGFANSTGGIYGGQVGYNYQMGQFVGGVEADLEDANLSRTGTTTLGTTKYSTGAMTTERLRAGFAVDRALLFVTGGYAGVETNGKFNDTVNGLSGSQSTWRNGAAIGGGIEYAFTNNISAKAEYLYVPLANQTYFAGTPDVVRDRYDLNVVRAGLNYKF